MTTIYPNWVDSVHGSQQAFRRVLSALSEPGCSQHFDHGVAFPPLNAAATQVVLSLCDQNTAVHFTESMQDSEAYLEAKASFVFHNGLKVTAMSVADFVVLEAEQSIDWEALRGGTPALPESGATLIIQSQSFSQGPYLRLTGPGIPQSRRIQLGALSDGLLDYLLQPSHRYPQGLDFLFCHQQQIIALSRTTKVELSPCM